MIEVALITGGFREIVVPGDLTLEQIHPLLKEGDIWPELAGQRGTFVNPAHIVLVREVTE